MTSFVNFTPILGANNEDSSCCYLLEIDDSKVLLDCGWDFTDPLKLEAVAKIAQTVDAVLLSHANFDHCGGYAYAVAKLGLDCPCFATTPVHDMGLQLMQDAISSKLRQTDFGDLNLEQVNRAFGKITLLRYSQPYTLGGKCAGIVITAFGAGHTVGGTVWKIKKDNEEIVYAVDFNHRKESHLNGTVLLSSDALARPSLFITASRQTTAAEVLTRKARDERLLETLNERLASGGSILIPVETSTRVLELAFTLEEHWRKHRLSFHLAFLSHQSQSTIVYAKSMLEWMGDSISQSFQTRDQPFDFRYLKCIQGLDELENMNGPKVILASFPGLDFGISNELLLQWAGYPNNCILFSKRPPVDSLGSKLFNEWQRADSISPVPLNLDIPLSIGRRAPLEGEELEEYLLKEEKEKEELANAPQELDLDNISESDDEENEELGGPAGVTGVPVYDIYVKDHVTRKGFFKQSQAFRMYPVHEVRNRFDEYGEIVDLSFYSKFEQKVPEDDYDLMDIEMPQPEEVIVKATPSKYIIEEVVLSLRCLVHYVDFEGRSDSVSLRNIIQQLSPRKLMLVHGTEKATNDLANFCLENDGITSEVFTPALLERVTVSTATNLFQVVLTDALVSSLRLSSLNDYNLAYISGVIKTQETPNGPQLFLEALPDMEKKQRKAVSVGDIKLSELRRHLTQQGFTSQFAQGGILVVNGAYVIQKNAQGGLSVDGRIHEDYYRLRSIVYAYNAMLS